MRQPQDSLTHIVVRLDYRRRFCEGHTGNDLSGNRGNNDTPKKMIMMDLKSVFSIGNLKIIFLDCLW